jgi:hypothetical protein
MTSAQSEKALSNFDTQQAGGTVSKADVAAAGGGKGSAMGSMAGGMIGGMMAGGIGSAIGKSIGSMAPDPSAMTGPALVGNNGVGAAQGISGNFNNQTGENGVGGSRGSYAGGGPADSVGSAGGIVGGAMNTPVPQAVATSVEVNGNLFGNLDKGGWSSATKRLGAMKMGVQ